MQVIMVARIAIPNLEVKALLVQIVHQIVANLANQARLAVVTVGRRLANRMVCKK